MTEKNRRVLPRDGSSTGEYRFPFKAWECGKETPHGPCGIENGKLLDSKNILLTYAIRGVNVGFYVSLCDECIDMMGV